MSSRRALHRTKVEPRRVGLIVGSAGAYPGTKPTKKSHSRIVSNGTYHLTTRGLMTTVGGRSKAFHACSRVMTRKLTAGCRNG